MKYLKEKTHGRKNSAALTLTLPSNREIVVTRLFEARTKPEHVAAGGNREVTRCSYAKSTSAQAAFGGSSGAGTLSTPNALGGTPVTLHLEVADCDEAVKRAVAAGAKVTMPPMDAFWGARYAQVVDPFGHAWSFAHPLRGNQG
jgi:uncharacterized glyoxalase superfamily protein PhnB